MISEKISEIKEKAEEVLVGKPEKKVRRATCLLLAQCPTRLSVITLTSICGF